MGVSNIYTVHKHFILKPNPYVPNDLSQHAYTKLVWGQATALLSLTYLALSLFKVFPKLTLNTAFKKFTVFQFGLSIGMFGWYAWELNGLRDLIPE